MAEYRGEHVRCDLVMAGYKLVDQVLPFLADFKEKKDTAWMLFQHYTDECRKEGKKRCAIYILDLVRHHYENKNSVYLPMREPVRCPNEWAPYFAVMYNGKYKVQYFKINKKGQKGNPDFYKELI